MNIIIVTYILEKKEEWIGESVYVCLRNSEWERNRQTDKKKRKKKRVTKSFIISLKLAAIIWLLLSIYVCVKEIIMGFKPFRQY